MDAPTALEHPEGRVVVQELGSGRKRVTVELFDLTAYVSEREFQTAYPLELIEAILELRGPAMLGYSIRRAEEPAHLTEPLRHAGVRSGSRPRRKAPTRLRLRQRLIDGDARAALSRHGDRGGRPRGGNISVARLRAADYGVGDATFLVSPRSRSRTTSARPTPHA